MAAVLSDVKCKQKAAGGKPNTLSVENQLLMVLEYWREGHLDHLLAKRTQLSRGHHAAMPYKDVPAFIATIRHGETLGPTLQGLALEFIVLTASRLGKRFARTGMKSILKARLGPSLPFA